jgi:hypothetical protein
VTTALRCRGTTIKHSGSLEAVADDGLVACFDHTGADEEMLGRNSGSLSVRRFSQSRRLLLDIFGEFGRRRIERAKKTNRFFDLIDDAGLLLREEML